MRRLQSFHRKCVRTFFRITLRQTWTHRRGPHQKTWDWFDARRFEAEIAVVAGARGPHGATPPAKAADVCLRAPARAQSAGQVWPRPPRPRLHATLPFIPPNLALNFLTKPHATPRRRRLESHEVVANWHTQDRTAWKRSASCQTPATQHTTRNFLCVHALRFLRASTSRPHVPRRCVQMVAPSSRWGRRRRKIRERCVKTPLNSDEWRAQLRFILRRVMITLPDSPPQPQMGTLVHPNGTWAKPTCAGVMHFPSVQPVFDPQKAPQFFFDRSGKPRLRQDLR